MFEIVYSSVYPFGYGECVNMSEYTKDGEKYPNLSLSPLNLNNIKLLYKTLTRNNCYSISNPCTQFPVLDKLKTVLNSL